MFKSITCNVSGQGWFAPGCILVNPHGIIVIVFQTKMLLILKYTLQIKDELFNAYSVE